MLHTHGNNHSPLGVHHCHHASHIHLSALTILRDAGGSTGFLALSRKHHIHWANDSGSRIIKSLKCIWENLATWNSSNKRRWWSSKILLKAKVLRWVRTQQLCLLSMPMLDFKGSVRVCVCVCVCVCFSFPKREMENVHSRFKYWDSFSVYRWLYMFLI